MIYLEIRERLGNQLFQYAFARYLTIKYNEKLSINFDAIIKRHDEKHGWKNSLDGFNVCNYYVDTEKNYSIIQKLLIHFLRLYTRHDDLLKINIKQRRLARILSKFGIFCLRNGYIKFGEPYKFIKDKIVIGYFESPKYFSEIDEVIKNEFLPKYPVLKHNINLYNLITFSESVCVTIRRGDFLSPENKDDVFICDKQYFYRGISIIMKQVPNAVLFIFSDDIDWVRNNMKFKGNVYFECGNDPLWEKLRLMSACKHFVISNSTFSWWAQHLSSNKNKIVIAPRIWRKHKRPIDIYEENWTLIDV